MILNTILQTSAAIETVSLTAQKSALSTEGILSSVDKTTLAIEEVAKSAQKQSELADELNGLIQKFNNTKVKVVCFWTIEIKSTYYYDIHR